MLKIKDEIELKELEKFGFVYEREHGLYSNRYIYVNKDNLQTVEINAEDRKILVEDISGSYSFGAIVDNALTVLYDLIQARISRESRGVEK